MFKLLHESFAILLQVLVKRERRRQEHHQGSFGFSLIAIHALLPRAPWQTSSGMSQAFPNMKQGRSKHERSARSDSHLSIVDSACFIVGHMSSPT